MPSKAQASSKDPAGTKNRSPQSPSRKPELSTQSEGREGTLIQRARSDPASLSSSDVIQLQRLMGNQAVIRLLQKQPQASNSVQRLPDHLENAMDTLFGGTRVDVNVRTDAQADRIARAANTDATAVGEDIFFREGAYRPGTAAGNAVIAREIAHVQRGKLIGSTSTRPSADASDAEKRDAEQVSGIVQVMGNNPAQTLQPVRKQLTPTQHQVIQRAGGFFNARTAGIVTSKVTQGIFTTVLGPLGLVWRWPLIQKNMAEALGTDFGTKKNVKADEKLRYGGGKLGEVLRFLSVYGEILKEMVIWLGFASLIAAIVAAATHGVAAPVFVGLSIATAITGGVLFLVKAALVGLNDYRRRKAEKLPEGADKDKKLAHIKHQMITDGMDAIGALLTTVFASLGAGGVASAGGALAKEAGVASTDAASKLAGSGMGMATQGFGTSVLSNFVKEGGKDKVKPAGETGFFGKGSQKKDDWGGFGKDAVEIKNAYKPIVSPLWSRVKGVFSKKDSGGDNQGPSSDNGGPSADAKQALDMTSAIVAASDRNLADQAKDSHLAKKDLATIDSVTPEVTKGADGVGDVTTNLKDVETKAKGFNPDQAVETTVKDEGTADSLTQRVNEGLKRAGEPAIAPKKPGFGSQISAWFSSKVTGLKGGVRRLSNRLLQDVMRFAGRFDKTNSDPSIVATTMNEEKRFASEDVQDEEKNDQQFGEFQGSAHTLSDGINALAEQENT